MVESLVNRVLQVHTRYRQPGGEEAVVEAEMRLLERAGVDVRQVIFDNADLRESESISGDLAIATAAIWSRAAKRRVAHELGSHRSQVMHVHNTFSAASPSVYRAASELGIPVVQTLHNYRPVCPKATAFRDGHPCTDCVGRPVPWPAVAHACIQQSRPRSLVTSATIAIQRARGTYSRGIATYLALTEFQRRLMVSGGLPAGRIRVIPNFVEPDPGAGTGLRSGLLFVGRLSEEKGIRALVGAAARLPGTVSAAGGGPLAPIVADAHAAGSLRYLGPLTPPAVADEIRRAVALLLPSVWFEGLPVVLIESYASGTPVIASEIGSLAEVVEDGVTGLLAAPGDAADLAERMRWAVAHPREMAGMGANARARYESRYRGSVHLEALLDAYGSALGGRPPHD